MAALDVGRDLWRPRKVSVRTREELAHEWDQVAAYRDRQIEQGRDLSYLHVLLPSITELLPARYSSVLDVGCGTGYFTGALAKESRDVAVTGIDPIAASIEIARQRCAHLDNVELHALSVEAFAERQAPGTFDVVIANMVLENVACLTEFLAATRRLVAPGGRFLIAIPHPCFWPRYWGYEDADWFCYGDETWIEAPFRTSLSTAPGAATTHVHRSLETYIDALADAGFLVERLREPYPGDQVKRRYPAAWSFPRFLVLRCRPV